MSRDLIERLRAPDRHDPACPFKKHCYCDDGAPHDSVQHPHALEAADEIERLRAELSSLRGEARQKGADMIVSARRIARTVMASRGLVRDNGKEYTIALDAALAALDHPTPDSDVIGRLVGALRAAEQFISNGVEMGFIRMPDKETPDTAHDTLPLIRQALASIPSTEGSAS